MADLGALKDYLSQDSPAAAISLIQKLLEAPERLEQFPLLGKKVAEADNPRIRELIVARSYRLIYLWDESCVHILGIIHVKRNLAAMEVRPWTR